MLIRPPHALKAPHAPSASGYPRGRPRCRRHRRGAGAGACAASCPHKGIPHGRPVHAAVDCAWVRFAPRQAAHARMRAKATRTLGARSGISGHVQCELDRVEVAAPPPVQREDKPQANHSERGWVLVHAVFLGALFGAWTRKPGLLLTAESVAWSSDGRGAHLVHAPLMLSLPSLVVGIIFFATLDELLAAQRAQPAQLAPSLRRAACAAGACSLSGQHDAAFVAVAVASQSTLVGSATAWAVLISAAVDGAARGGRWLPAFVEISIGSTVMLQFLRQSKLVTSSSIALLVVAGVISASLGPID